MVIFGCKEILVLGVVRDASMEKFYTEVDCVRRSTPALNVQTCETFSGGEARLRAEAALRRAKVEPERIELSSREDNIVLSTCLVDFILSGTTRQATA